MGDTNIMFQLKLAISVILHHAAFVIIFYHALMYCVHVRPLCYPSHFQSYCMTNREAILDEWKTTSEQADNEMQSTRCTNLSVAKGTCSI